MPASKNKKSSSTRKTTTGRSGSRSRSTTTRKTTTRSTKTPTAKNTDFISGEITFLLILAVCILLLISCFGFGSKIGSFFGGVQFGLFGTLAYIFPIVFFAQFLYLRNNDCDLRSVIKTISSAAVYILTESLIHLFFADKDAAASGLYKYCSTKAVSGGLLGGGVYGILNPIVGNAFECILTLILIIIFLVVITEHSFVSDVEAGSRKVATRAKEETARKQELRRMRIAEREELRRQQAEAAAKEMRSDRKVTGINLDDIVIEAPEEKGHLHELKDDTKKKKKNVDAAPQESRGESASEVSAAGAGAAAATITAGSKAAESAANVATGFSSGRPDPKAADSLPDTDSTEGSASESDFQKGKSQFTITGLHVADHSDQDDMEIFEDLFEDESASKAEEITDSHTGRLSEMRIVSDTDDTDDYQAKPSYDDSEDGLEFIDPDSDEFSLDDDYEIPQASSPITPADTSARRTDPVKNNPIVASAAASGRKKDTRPAVDDGEIVTQEDIEEEILALQTEEVIKEYQFPPLDLLEYGKNKVTINENSLRETAAKLEEIFHNFGVNVTVTNVSCGPSVTRYELQPEQGVKVSKIVSLSDDIKLNLAAADIRIEAPIPGKAAVGIEVPNKENSAVMLRELLETDKFQNHASKIAFAVGKDIGGEPEIADIGKMPHLLIAGATGSGKSVCINTIIMSILYRAKPDEVKLIMIDPKVVELSVYNGIPHLLIPVVTDPKKASGALNWAVAEMMDRYQKFAESSVRDLKGYNAKVEKMREAVPDSELKPLPQIVIIVDELADLMMVSPGEVEDAICRLAQLARACGIHLIIATQRPSVNVITGLIKANMPSRIAFSVTSGVDSRTILDMVGAEKLLGKGDMLYYPQGLQKPARVQGAFVSDEEVNAVVEFLKEENQTAVYSKEVQEKMNQAPQTSTGADNNNGASSNDEFFIDAGFFIIEKEKASIGMLQRRFKIGFNRAARIMDQLAEAGVVGEEEGTKPRKVLMSAEEFQLYIEEYNV